MTRRLVPRLRRRRDERPLLVRAREDPEVFAEFYGETYEQVLAFFARRTLDPDTAFDLMAETFAAAFAALHDFRGETDDEAYGWLWAIARNQLSAWRRRGKVSRESMERIGLEPAAMSDVEYERVEELADAGRLRTEIAQALHTLSGEQQQAVRMRVLEDCSYEEMARALQVTQQVARARVSRGLRTLALVLQGPSTATGRFQS